MMMWDLWVLGLPCEPVSPTRWPVDRPQVGEYPDAYAKRLILFVERKTGQYMKAVAARDMALGGRGEGA